MQIALLQLSVVKSVFDRCLFIQAAQGEAGAGSQSGRTAQDVTNDRKAITERLLHLEQTKRQLQVRTLRSRFFCSVSRCSNGMPFVLEIVLSSASRCCAC